MEWKTSSQPVDYPQALALMEERVERIIAGTADEMVWLLEHPPLYTRGTSAKESDLLAPNFPIYDAGRGGEFTYHGPGQRVAYVMLDLKKRNAMDVRAYVCALEQWIVDTLRGVGVSGFTREKRTGVWVSDDGRRRTEDRKEKEMSPVIRHPSSNVGEAKIAAIGIRIRKWVTFHGISINVSPDLSHYAGIVPCGIQGYGVTSLKQLGVKASMEEVDALLKSEFEKNF